MADTASFVFWGHRELLVRFCVCVSVFSLTSELCTVGITFSDFKNIIFMLKESSAFMIVN